VPLFVPLLMGGEIVIAFLIVRVAMWILRSWALLRTLELRPTPPGGGVPAEPPRSPLHLVRPAAATEQQRGRLSRAA